MKVFISFFSSLIILLSGSKNFIMMADYHMNRSYYEQICINKNKPDLQCHGKCKMKKNSANDNSSLNLERYCTNFIYATGICVDADCNTFSLSAANKIPVLKMGQLPRIISQVPSPPPVS